MQYREFQESDLDALVRFYLDYYNSQGGSWDYETARRRIHQTAFMEDALVLLQFEGEMLTGFLMGWFKCFDDSTGFYLEEILVSAGCQNKGCGSDFLQHLKAEVKRRGGSWIELLTTLGAQHQNFYRKNGFSRSDNLVLEYMDL